jgi:hypothetical protein
MVQFESTLTNRDFGVVTPDLFPSKREKLRRLRQEQGPIRRARKIECDRSAAGFPPVVARSGDRNLPIDFWLALPSKTTHRRHHEKVFAGDGYTEFEVIMLGH